MQSCSRLLRSIPLIASLSITAWAGATPPPAFAYFIDNFSAENIEAAVPQGTVLIGWATPAQRQGMTASGRIVGASAGLGACQCSTPIWGDPTASASLAYLLNHATPDMTTLAGRLAFANQILAVAVAPTEQLASVGFPAAGEATPTAKGGYVLWAQDLEGRVDSGCQPFGIGPSDAAAVLALMWAGREVLGSDMEIIPVLASIFLKTPAACCDLRSVLDGSPQDKFVSVLNLKGTLSAANQTELDLDHIDLVSALHLLSAEGHPLIDGILPEQYAISDCVIAPDFCYTCQEVNCAAIPGSFSSDTVTFFDRTLPYAIMSSHDCPNQLFVEPPAGGCPGFADSSAPWKTYYRGTMPFQAGVYWAQTTIDPATVFDPHQYLIPTPASSDGSNGGLCPADITGDRTIDGSDLSVMLGSWGSATPTSPADLNGDFEVNAADMTILLGAWGVCPPAAPRPLSWIKVLVAEDVPPTSQADLQTYVAKIQVLAPALEQIHLRYRPDGPGDQAYADLIGMFRAAYGSTLAIGFHPDNSSGSCAQLWNCHDGDCATTNVATWQCVLSASIDAMNSINAIADPYASGEGFTIFSLEQSYVEDMSNDSPNYWLSHIKATLGGSATSLRAVHRASPPVKFGTVGPSIGGPEIYGPNGFDFGYPQMYNLRKALPSGFGELVTATTPYFPANSAQACIDGASLPYSVVDVDSNAAYARPKIPCFGPLNAPNVYTFSDPTHPGPDPILAAAYVGFLLTQYPPVSNIIELSGAEVFMMFSGEPDFLGSPGWTLDKIDEFHQQLNVNFALLQSVPGLIPAGGADPKSLQYGIWNFGSILDRIVLP